MKKILPLILISTLTFQLTIPQQVFAKDHSFLKPFFGIILLAAGAYMAVDGFSKKEVVTYEAIQTEVPETPAPALTQTILSLNSNWSPSDLAYVSSVYVSAKNAGNVTLKNIYIGVDLYDSNENNCPIWSGINYSYATPPSASIGQEVAVQFSNIITVGGKPTSGKASFLYGNDASTVRKATVTTFRRKTEEETKNLTMGIGGIVSASLGTYLIVDYFVKKSKTATKRVGVIPIKNAAGCAIQYKFG